MKVYVKKIRKAYFRKTFGHMWKELESELNKIHIEGGEKLPVRSEREILEEILELVRGMSRLKTIEYDASYKQAIKDIMEKINKQVMLDKSDNFYIPMVKKSDTDTDKGNCAPAP